MQRARTETAKDSRRHQILEAALDEFYEHGFAAARIKDIAERAGLSKAAVYLYFDTKDTLFEALIDTMASPKLEMIQAIAESTETFDDAIDRLALIAPTLIQESRLPRLMKVIIGDSHGFPDIVERYRQNIIDQLLETVATVLQRANDREEIAVEHPKLTARLVMAPMVVSGLWQAVFSKAPDTEADLETIFRLHAQNMKRALCRPH